MVTSKQAAVYLWISLYDVHLLKNVTNGAVAKQLAYGDN